MIIIGAQISTDTLHGCNILISFCVVVELIIPPSKLAQLTLNFVVQMCLLSPHFGLLLHSLWLYYIYIIYPMPPPP